MARWKASENMKQPIFPREAIPEDWVWATVDLKTNQLNWFSQHYSTYEAAMEAAKQYAKRAEQVASVDQRNIVYKAVVLKYNVGSLTAVDQVIPRGSYEFGVDPFKEEQPAPKTRALDPNTQAMLDASRGEGYISGAYAIRELISDRQDALMGTGKSEVSAELMHLLLAVDAFVKERLRKNDI
jgi:hypothetical protein